jgi:hypothetical protein
VVEGGEGIFGDFPKSASVGLEMDGAVGGNRVCGEHEQQGYKTHGISFGVG